MLTDQNLQRVTIYLGESLFYSDKFAVDYAVADDFKARVELHAFASFTYIYEGLPHRLTEEVRFKRLLDYGTPLFFEPIEMKTARDLPNGIMICAPVLFEKFSRQNFSPKVMHRASWIAPAAGENAFDAITEFLKTS